MIVINIWELCDALCLNLSIPISDKSAIPNFVLSDVNSTAAILFRCHFTSEAFLVLQHTVYLDKQIHLLSEMSPFSDQHVGDKSETIESDGILKDLADKVSNIDAEMQLLEGEYKKDLLDHDKVCLLLM